MSHSCRKKFLQKTQDRSFLIMTEADQGLAKLTKNQKTQTKAKVFSHTFEQKLRFLQKN